MAFSHFIWDFDGTLYDSYPVIVSALALGLEDMGLPLPEEGELTRLAKITLRHASLALAGERQAEALLARCAVHASQLGIGAMRPYPGCREALLAVLEGGGFNYLYTHRNRQAVEALERDGMDGLFRDFITSEAGFPHKPAPDALNWLAAQHGLNPNDCVMVGDRPIDTEAGHNAGMAAALFDPDGFYGDLPLQHRFRKLTDIPRTLLKAAG